MKALLRKRKTLLKKMEDCSEFFRGSITSVCSTCNRAACICLGKSTKKAHRLTYKNTEQKTRTVYISRAQRPSARKMLTNDSRMRNLMEELHEINVSIFKEKSKR